MLRRAYRMHSGAKRVPRSIEFWMKMVPLADSHAGPVEEAR
jgi:hypothetical protein